jgi:hypothetical protein
MNSDQTSRPQNQMGFVKNHFWKVYVLEVDAPVRKVMF